MSTFSTTRKSSRRRDSKKAKDLSVMSFNILAPIWVGDNGKKAGSFDNMPTTTYFKTENRRKLVVKTILEAHPDVLLLQECQESELKFLQKALTEYTLVTSGFHGQDTNGNELWAAWIPQDSIHKWQRNGNPIFVRSSLLKSTKYEPGTIQLSCDGMSAGTLVLTVNDKRIGIVNAHLAHPTDTPLNAGIANNEAQWEKIELFKANEGVDHILVAGDFNVNDTESFYTKVNRQYTDHGEQHGVLDGTCTSIKYATPHGVDRHTERIDYMFSDGLKCTNFKSLVPMPATKKNQIQEALEKCGSDHLPLYAEFRV